jgi:hypothetical protein
MNRTHSSARFAIFALAILVATPLLRAQQQASVVPTLVNFSGVLTAANGKPLTGTVGATFSLYKDQQGGAPLWLETQNVQPDKSGHYSVMLGSAGGHGLPPELFASGEARWLGVQAQGQAEQPRVMLLAVPYALKAGDAQTIGGLPASAFVLATPVAPTGTAVANSESTSSSNPAPPAGTVTGSGTVNFLPIWTGTSTIGNSVLFQAGTGAKAKLGIGTTKPASTLDVKGGGTIRGLFSLPATGTATASAGFKSQPMDLAASVFNSGTGTAATQTFQWQTEPVGNNTTSATGSLNLLFGQGTNKPTETGLNVASNGKITFATGQTFPGTGTITGVTAGTDLTGGGASGNVTLNVDTAKVVTGVTAGTDLTGGGTGGTPTLNLDTTKVPQLSANNSFVGNQSISGNLSATGSITGQTANFSASNGSQVVNVTQSGSGLAIAASSPGNDAIFGSNTASANGVGVGGQASGTGGIGVSGTANNASSGAGVGVLGYSASPGGFGLYTYATGSLGVGAYGRWQNGSSNFSGGSQIGVWGDSSQGTGVVGTSDNRAGVFGESSTGQGAAGFSISNAGVYGETNYDLGVYGVTITPSSVGGIEGVHYSTSNTGAGFTTFGVWGDTGVSGGLGVVGTADDGNSLFGKNNTVNHETLYVENDSGFSNGLTPYAARFAGPGASTYCYIPRDSNDNGTGDLVCTGSKSAAVPVDGNRMVRLYAVEAADNWFEDAGSGQLASGSATVAFDQVFAQTVNGDVDYHVFITPNGECEGLYVTHKSAQGFEVHELHRGHSSIAFDYRIMARRKGFENVRMQDVTDDFAHMKQESDLLAARLEAGKLQKKEHPKLAIPTLPKRLPLSSPQTMARPVLPVGAAAFKGAVK